MNTMRNYRSSLLLALSLMTAMFAIPASAGEIVLIANNGIPVKAINKSQARLIFTKDVKIWSDGSDIKVAIMKPSGELHSRFSQEVLNLYPYQIDRALERKRYSGNAYMEVVVNSPDEMLKWVANTPGAIGYADNSAVALLGDVKILKINNE